ncbi:MAG: N-formylglutamate amidohydrolase [Rhodobacteraceae bacterium]|nr:N-formylglutamate amidohydrolase [Paracoccaceae bacterium]
MDAALDQLQIRSGDSAAPPAAFHETHPLHWSAPVLFASPHSGRSYPVELLRRTRLDGCQIRSIEDAYVDRLFAPATDYGAPLIHAAMARAFVDLNRAPEELDPALISGVRRYPVSRRTGAGFGVIPRLVAGERRIYHGRIGHTEAMRRIADFHIPYHQRLKQLMDEGVHRHGEVVLFDCHSMPRRVLDASFPPARRPGIILGDRYGASCGRMILEQAESVFAGLGFKVSRNIPFAGAYVSKFHGHPHRRRHVLQVEIDRSLYLDEARIRPNADYPAFCDRMRKVVAGLTRITGSR